MGVKTMKQIKKLKFTVMVIMVFTMLLLTSETYAYWSNGIRSNSLAYTIRVTIGEWNQTFPWRSTMTYQAGDRISYNGNTYEARFEHAAISPNSFLGFFVWRRI
jgi:hypothetical protein